MSLFGVVCEEGMQAIVSVVNIFVKIDLMRYSVGKRLFLDVDGRRCVRVRGDWRSFVNGLCSEME